MTAADVLRQAAELVEQRAAAASSGPWVADSMCPCSRDGEEYDWCEDRDHSPTVHTLRGPGRGPHVVSYQVADFHSSAGNVAWVALVGPQVADPLAAWLRAEADVAEHAETANERNVGPNAVDEAVALARAILGESS